MPPHRIDWLRVAAWAAAVFLGFVAWVGIVTLLSWWVFA